MRSQINRSTIKLLFLGLVLIGCLNFISVPAVNAGSLASTTTVADSTSPYTDPLSGAELPVKDECGGGKDSVKLSSINIGCRGIGNPIVDALLAISKFLSLGAGIIMIGAIIVAGMQFSASRSNPDARAKAIKRIWVVLGALILFMFTFALLNWLIPGGPFV